MATRLSDQARAIWEATPHLAYVHADMTCFVMAHLTAHRGALDALEQACDGYDALDAASQLLAQARIRAVHTPEDAGPDPAFSRVRDVATLWLYGPVGVGSLAAARVIDWIDNNADARVLYIRIASAGGTAEDAIQIAERISKFPGTSLAIVDRFAYSAASAIACAAKRCFIRKSASWLAHQTIHFVSGNVDDLIAFVGQARGKDQRIAGLYARRRNLTPAAAYDLIRAGAYLSAAQAVAAGVCDRVINDLPNIESMP
jgi:ATP-dependent protease ClpP protease subunit